VKPPKNDECRHPEPASRRPSGSIKFKEKLYNRSLRFLSFRARSEKEVADYLQKIARRKEKNSPAQISLVTTILKKLKKLNLINDSEFTQWWIEQRLNLNPKGKRALRMELRQKGVAQEIIDQQLQLISLEIFQKAAQKIIDKKMRLYSCLPQLKLKKKLFAFLLSRGFDYQLAQKVIDENLKKR
jgi:regulatory protein